jgi:hypothetical protein
VLLSKHEKITDQLRAAVHAERERTKSAKSAQLASQAQQGELHLLVRSLLEHVRSKRGVAGQPQFAVDTSAMGHSRISKAPRNIICSRPNSALQRPNSSKVETLRAYQRGHSDWHCRPQSSPAYGTGARKGGRGCSATSCQHGMSAMENGGSLTQIAEAQHLRGARRPLSAIVGMGRRDSRLVALNRPVSAGGATLSVRAGTCCSNFGLDLADDEKDELVMVRS